MYKNSQFALALVVAVALVSPCVTAEEAAATASPAPERTSQQASPTQAGYHAGGLRFRPSLSIDARYDDNIFAEANGERGDWITTLSPLLRVDSTWDRHKLQAQFGAKAGRYWEYDAENFLDYWASISGRFDITDATNLFGGAGLAYEHEGRDSPDATLSGQEPTTYRSLNAHAGVGTQLADTALRIGVTYEALDFNDIGAGANLLINDDRDRELVGFGVRATHPVSATTQVFAQAIYDLRLYDLPVDQDGYDRDSEGYRASIGFKSDLGDGNSAEAYLGILGQSYDDSRFDDVSKADFGGKLTLTPAQDTRLTARLERSLNETTVNASPGYIRTQISSRLEHRLSARIIPHVSLAYEFADYLQSDREDRTYSAEAGVRYLIGPNVYIVGGLRHAARDSNDRDRLTGSNDFEKNILFLTLSAQGYPKFEPLVSGFNTEAGGSIDLLSVSDDVKRFGRYNGLDESGLYWSPDVWLRANDGQKGYADIRGLDLGLDSRSLELIWGSQGDYEAYVRYDQIPFHDFTGKTIFDGVNSTELTRPAGWVAGEETTDFTTLADSLSDVEIGTMRKRLDAGTVLHDTDNNWTFTLDYQTESKEGLTQMAGVAGISPGNARSALLPTPVDYTTNKVTAALHYQGERSRFGVSYHGSFFYDNLEALRWQSPFSPTASTPAGPAGARGIDGRLSLPPDNQFHQLTVSATHDFTPATRLNAMASLGLMLQDEDFLDDTVAINRTPSTLPRSSLDGEVYQYNALLSLTSRPLRNLNLKASYRMDRRDNKTPQDPFTYYVNDTPSNTTFTLINQPYSYDRRTLKLDGAYRVNRLARISGLVSRETTERVPSEVRKTTENKGELRLKLNPLDDLQVSLKGTLASRTGSDYQTVTGENPLLRKYNISDRERESYGIEASYQVSDRLSLNGSYDVNDDDYDQTRVGLTDAKQKTLAVDASYLIGNALSAHAYAERDVYESAQSGSQDPVTPDWFVANDDRVDTVGVGMRWAQGDKLELGVDYTLSKSTGETRMISTNPIPPLVGFPDLKSKLHSLRLKADYKLNRNSTLRLGYWYEKYDAEDWSTNGVGVAGIPEVLLLGEDDPSYDQHVVGVSIAVKF